MRRRIPLMLIGLLLLTGISCQDELAARYNNPDKSATATIDKLFTSLLNDDRTRPAYWEMSTFINWHIGIYTQAVGFLNTVTVYQQNDSYVQDRWNDFYRTSANGSGVMSLYREMEKVYAALPQSSQPEAALFLRAGQVFLWDKTTQMVDLWGDIPFSEAGRLNASGEAIAPRFDDARQLYRQAIDSLQVLSEYFAQVSPSAAATHLFSTQDILLGGDIDRWRRYTNTLRLRLLMRISYDQEAFAQTAVTQMLADPVRYPLLNDDAYDPARHDILLTPLSDYVDDLHAAFSDWTNYSAPYYVLEDVLKPANDLRIPVMFDRYGQVLNNRFVPNNTYKALPLTLTAIEQQASLGQYAILDSTTLLYNSRLPGVVMTVSEMNFLRAEAYERWGGGDAATEFSKGILHSVIFYYYLNNLNITRTRLTPPTRAAMDDFVQHTPALRYADDTPGRLRQIWTQKWVHFGWLQVPQRWAEQRRTRTPALSFYPSALTGFEGPPRRLTYPSNERNLNANYSAVAAKDTRDQRIFWDVLD